MVPKGDGEDPKADGWPNGEAWDPKGEEALALLKGLAHVLGPPGVDGVPWVPPQEAPPLQPPTEVAGVLGADLLLTSTSLASFRSLLKIGGRE